MRIVTAGLFMSIDGVVADPFRFQFDSFDDELGAGMSAMIASTSTVLLGRRSYDEWSEYWPAHPDDDFGRFINPIEKFVASRSRSGPLAWEHASLIEGDLETFVRDLKGDDDGSGNIAVCGSISVVRQLLFAGLLDELLLMIHPVIAGAGKRLFEPTDPPTRLTLLDGQTTSKGNALLRYRLRED